MSRIFYICMIFCTLCYAGAPKFDPAQTHTFELKKDEWARVFITEKATQKQDVFDFRWTLYDSTNIVVQSFFRRYPRQMSLSLRHGVDTYMQRILPDFTMPTTDAVKLYLSFVKFENRKASFNVNILDESKRIDVSFIDPPVRSVAGNTMNNEN
ncbi:hypothetical protein KDD93_05915 [Campylobacter sp. faydin G-24]|uniref:Exporting protein n=1 Tax=Campylobacter anatolicus TaxID=2829105 RepID=A0ABS5HKN6_9BACT|nr:hypothetical protein [Campylobacter anatolicus]MBR8464107.1 hypothetical protein [Campylobacter anatolicus]